MSAILRLAKALPNDSIWRLLTWQARQVRSASFAVQQVGCAPTRTLTEARAALVQRWEHDLAALLNECGAAELAYAGGSLGCAAEASSDGMVGASRLRLWEALRDEREQAAVRLIGQRLVQMTPLMGIGSADGHQPVRLPLLRDDNLGLELAEPETIDELLERANHLIGVRLGARGRDKGAWGVRVAELLGVPERGDDEPDWRGDVEIKTVPVEQVSQDLWRIVEDPAICTEDVVPWRKLGRVLWLCRASLPGGDAAVVAWYYLENLAQVEPLLARYLHLRPKGPAGTLQKGHYLHKRFFTEVGLVTMLCGGAP